MKRTNDREGARVRTHVASDVDDANVVWYFEEWPAVDAFERHLRSEGFTRVLAVMEIAAEAPVLECRLVSETRGLDYVAAVRGVPAAPPDAARH